MNLQTRFSFLVSGFWLLPPAACRLLPSACRLLPAFCLLPSAFCLLPSAACRLPPAACRLRPAACRLAVLRPSSLRKRRRFNASFRQCPIQLLTPVSHVTARSVAIDHSQRNRADIRQLMEHAPWNVHSLTGSERHLLIAQAHLALALQNQVDFFLILVVPRHLSAVRFKRDVAQRRGFRLNRTRASHQVLSAPPGRISSSSDLGKIRDDHAQSTGPMRQGTNSLCPSRSLAGFFSRATP